MRDLGLVNETNLVHDLFLVYFINFIYNLYMFRTSPGPSSGGTTVFMRHLVLVILYTRHLKYRLEFRLEFVQLVKKFLCLLAPKYLLPFFTLFIPCMFLQSIYQPTNAINKIQFITRIKLLHVSATGCHP